MSSRVLLYTWTGDAGVFVGFADLACVPRESEHVAFTGTVYRAIRVTHLHAPTEAQGRVVAAVQVEDTGSVFRLPPLPSPHG